MTVLKSQREIKIMQEGGAVLARILAKLATYVEPGSTPLVLEKEALRLFKKHKVEPAFLGYRGFPAALCVSVNDTVVHGIPTDELFKEGDLVSLDIGCFYRGLCVDMARTYGSGTLLQEALSLLETTRQALEVGIKQAQAGKFTGDIGHAIQKFVESRGYSVVRELVGHGVGKSLHEDPQVPNFGSPGEGEKLLPGMTLAIEPMVNLGSPEVYWAEDGWTVKTKDGKLSAHFEDTIAITENGAQILTVYE